MIARLYLTAFVGSFFVFMGHLVWEVSHDRGPSTTTLVLGVIPAALGLGVALAAIWFR